PPKGNSGKSVTTRHHGLETLVKMLLHQATETLQIAHALDFRPKGGEVGQELGEVATDPGQTPQRKGGTIESKFSFNQLQQNTPSLGGSRQPQDGASLDQCLSLAEDPWIAQAAPADRHAVRAGFF